MQDIIGEILQAEQEAEELLEKTRQEASSYRMTTDQMVNKKIADARSKAHSIIQSSVEKARHEAVRARSDALEKAEQESRRIADQNRSCIDDLVAQIVDLVIGPEYE